MEAVLPLKIRPDGRGTNLASAAMLCHSLAHFWADTQALTLTVICPADELAISRTALATTAPNLDLRFVSELDIVPTLAADPALPGWLRQQILKLAIYRTVTSEFYLCLDADIICCNPIGAEILLPNGKALTEYGSRGRHADWWRNSAKMLGTEPRLERPGMRVTPAVLSRQLVEKLHLALPAQDGGPSWHRLMQTPVLSNGYWTEYTLYQLCAEQAGLMEDFHVSFAEYRALNRPLISGKSLWSPQDVADLDLAQLFGADDPALFIVLQSSAHPPVERIWAQFREHHGVAAPAVLPSFAA